MMDFIHLNYLLEIIIMNNKLMDIINEKMKNEQLTVTEFCTDLGIEDATYHMWENNPDTITLSSIRKIISLLNFTDTELIEIFK